MGAGILSEFSLSGYMFGSRVVGSALDARLFTELNRWGIFIVQSWTAWSCTKAT
jgi:hypothetical protein